MSFVEPTCTDGLKNALETDVDCGGSNCPKCDNYLKCGRNDDCKSEHCGADGKCSIPTCSDRILNGDETDIDCGGSCLPCKSGQKCHENHDCDNVLCTDDTCQSNLVLIFH